MIEIINLPALAAVSYPLGVIGSLIFDGRENQKYNYARKFILNPGDYGDAFAWPARVLNVVTERILYFFRDIAWKIAGH